jgi:signal transduction histidine kinase
MSAEVGAHIFEKFYQGDPSRATQGNGLGLSLVKRVIDITRGEIAVQSAVGAGTTFTVKIRRMTDGYKEAR